MGKDSQRPKKKKEKITYIDDGSTVADMSGVRGNTPLRRPTRPSYGRQKPEPTTRMGSVWQTYTNAVRAMIGPMLIFLGGMSLVFLAVWVILGFFA
jgi:hypothetical protein